MLVECVRQCLTFRTHIHSHWSWCSAHGEGEWGASSRRRVCTLCAQVRHHRRYLDCRAVRNFFLLGPRSTRTLIDGNREWIGRSRNDECIERAGAHCKRIYLYLWVRSLSVLLSERGVAFTCVTTRPTHLYAAQFEWFSRRLRFHSDSADYYMPRARLCLFGINTQTARGLLTAFWIRLIWEHFVEMIVQEGQLDKRIVLLDKLNYYFCKLKWSSYFDIIECLF